MHQGLHLPQQPAFAEEISVLPVIITVALSGLPSST
jgi:hypothetical protein